MSEIEEQIEQVKRLSAVAKARNLLLKGGYPPAGEEVETKTPSQVAQLLLELESLRESICRALSGIVNVVDSTSEIAQVVYPVLRDLFAAQGSSSAVPSLSLAVAYLSLYIANKGIRAICQEYMPS